MPSDLWSFTLDFYARPGVEQACLTLQADGANVCMLLCGVWLDLRGVACSPERLREVIGLAEPWHDDVVRPLREVRTGWKQAAQHNIALARLRERVKALELDAERQLLIDLETLALKWAVTDGNGDREWLSALAGSAGSANSGALQVLRAAAGQAEPGA
ncbi:TIGR02444 family protein [Pseudomonas sp. JDS28PS106]|uniref:TIGR02444 family protein n=1 Tax=Pseudomonas sp. JDS28PS106 TaxID=2497235 RepID=UPI002FD6EE61